MTRILVGTLFAALTSIVAWQGLAIRSLRQEIAQARPVSQEMAAAEIHSRPAREVRTRVASDGVSDHGLNGRVAALEESVAELHRGSEFLMDRGQIPLSSERIVELQQKFMDPNLRTRDRMQALSLLQRNSGINDAVIQHALSLISSSTNNVLREGLVRELGTSTNALLRAPMIQLATTDSDPRVRENAIRSLRRFVDDPQVETALWQSLRSEQDRRVQEQVAEALREAPVTPARLADLRNRAVAESSSLDERLTAVRALHRAGQGADDATAALAQLVQSSQNPEERARVFSAFNGINEPQMMVPLVYGLQDANATVRARAADALSNYKSEPAVAEWLRYVAQNDADSRVRREAETALRERREGGPAPREGGPGPRGRR
jgi:hypothetical protein